MHFKDLMQDALGLTESQFQRLVARSPYTYKTYTIPKKSGGVRTIAQPAKETKYIQYWLVEKIFSKLPIHDCATAYKTGASIKANANKHKNNQYLSKFDFINFFPSIKEMDLISHLTTHLSDFFSSEDIKIITRISCIRGKGESDLCLSIGAPSSPVLSNSIMYHFDSEINLWCESKKITYTRYADDLTFSTNEKNISSEIEHAIRKTIKKIKHPKLIINDKKTIHISKKYQRRITGVIVNNEGNLSLGREKKRIISSLIHKYTIGLLAHEDLFNLQGLLGFSKDIEPDFVFKMRKKYGSDIVDSIFKVRRPSK